jgi:hypothetical protein
MAGADYYSCDICGAKTFYGSDLDWREGDKENDYNMFLPGVGEMVVICKKCSAVYEIKLVPKRIITSKK